MTERFYIPGPETEFEEFVNAPLGIPVGENLFGWTLLHAGQSYVNDAMTPPGRMKFKWSRQFASWRKVERSQEKYDWTCGGEIGQNVQARAEEFAQRGLSWSLVLNPGGHPDFYPGYERGPLHSPEPYERLLNEACIQFTSLGLRAIEIGNEPESGSWCGTLGRPPSGHIEMRQAARELAPWARIAKRTVKPYDVEVWGPSCQSMANALPDSGLAYVFCSPDGLANTRFRGAGFLNGHDGEGGIGAQWIDRFTFHGYPSPSHDSTLLAAHFAKARSWLVGCGYPDKPMVVTEHGVYHSTGSMRINWRDMTAGQRIRWVISAFGVTAAFGARMIFYAWDDEHMGIYGKNGWLPEHEEIEDKYDQLRSTLIGSRIYQLGRCVLDGRFVLRVGKDHVNTRLVFLE